jgi:hypothetical protein
MSTLQLRSSVRLSSMQAMACALRIKRVGTLSTFQIRGVKRWTGHVSVELVPVPRRGKHFFQVVYEVAHFGCQVALLGVDGQYVVDR